MFRPAIASLALSIAACATSGRAPVRPRPAGDAAWVAAARAELARFDVDRSGGLDAAEVAALPCPMIVALDAELSHDTSVGLAVTFGLEPGLLWRGDHLGFALPSRDALARHLELCLGVPPAVTRDAAALAALAALADEPTSAAWDRAVRGILVSTYDRNGSGELDAGPEVDTIPCDIWLYLGNASFDGRDEPLLAVYGISDGYLWIGDALGLARTARDAAFAAATACGLAPD